MSTGKHTLWCWKEMTLQDSSSKTFKNTFAPHMRNKDLNVQAVIMGLRVSLLRHEDLPQEVQEAVAAELKRQRAQQDHA